MGTNRDKVSFGVDREVCVIAFIGKEGRNTGGGVHVGLGLI